MKVIAATPGVDEMPAAFSPDGRWLAFLSGQGGTTEVFLQRLADGTKFQVSNGGGNEPVWASTSKELYFRTLTHVMAVQVHDSKGGHIGRPRPLFEDKYARWGSGNFDITPDGKQFVMVRSAASASATRLNLHVGWFDELKRLATSK